jgi:hypothetical protein
MTANEIQLELRRRPFRAFRMHLGDGSRYDVTHPEMVLLGRCELVLGQTDDPDEGVFDQAVDIDLVDIVRLEPIKAPAAG